MGVCQTQIFGVETTPLHLAYPNPRFQLRNWGLLYPHFQPLYRILTGRGFGIQNGGLSKADLGVFCPLRAPCRNHSSPFGLPKPPFPAPKLSASLGDFDRSGLWGRKRGFVKTRSLAIEPFVIHTRASARWWA